MTSQTSLLGRWGRFTVRHKWFVLGAWVVALALMALTARAVARGTVNTMDIPGAESQQAVDALRRSFPERSGDYADVVFAAPGGVDSPEIKAAIDSAVSQAAAIPGVVAVASPFAPTGLISSDRTAAIARVQFAQQADDVPSASASQLDEVVRSARVPGLSVELGGPVAAAQEHEGPSESTVLGLVAALVILYILFRALTPTVLPIASALTGLVIGFTAIYAMTAAIDLSKFAPNIAAMLGLGVGIDYALFIVARYRENVSAGHGSEDSVAIALATAGKSVLFAGGVVITSLLGLSLMGIPFVGRIGIAAALMVTVAVAAALSLLPALLGLTGRFMARQSAKQSVSGRTYDPAQNRWYRLGHAIMRRPYLFLAASTAILVVLSIPVVGMRLGSADAGSNPASSTTRRAYDTVSERFGPGMSGPLQVVLDGASAADAARVRSAVQASPNVASVSAPIVNAGGDMAVLSVVPTSSPQSSETADLVHDLRNRVLPAATSDGTGQAYIGGATARAIDIADRIAARLPVFFALVIGVSFLLLVLVFRSIMIPLKAALMNLLSIGAAYGFVIAVFQWGWGLNLVGLDTTAPIESFLPMMLFAVLFGLSMDYEVFLVSRIHEEYLRTRDNAVAVARGLAATASVITAAATVMIVVFLSFVLNDQRVVKEFGLGLAVAVLVDATVVRLMLVPATMELLGHWNWWLPAWLDRWLPHVSIEGEYEEESAGAGVTAGLSAQ